MTGPQGPLLRIEAAVTAGTATVVISGEIDVTTAPLLSRQLAQIVADRPQRLVFDMSGVDFIDCGAARLIAGTVRFLPEGHRPVFLRARTSFRTSSESSSARGMRHGAKSVT